MLDERRAAIQMSGDTDGYSMMVAWGNEMRDPFALAVVNRQLPGANGYQASSHSRARLIAFFQPA
jgi:hypothetical protein